MCDIDSDGVLAVDDHLFDERVLQLDAVRGLFADERRDGRQEEQRAECEDSETDRRQQDVEEREPRVLPLRLALLLAGDAVAKAASIHESSEASPVVLHPLVAHPASAQ